MAYHVLLEGRRMGPYDRRTIVGLRIKERLNGDHLLEASDGSRLTVAQLFAAEAGAPDFNPVSSGSYSSAILTCKASVVDSERGAVELPVFRGDVEVRVHPEQLRISGSHRHGRGWQDGRVKLPLRDITHVRVTGSRVDLWLGNAQGKAFPDGLQRIGLELFSAETAHELLRSLPHAQVWPEAQPQAGPAAVARAPVAAVSPLLWAAVVGVVLVAAIVLLVLLRRTF